MKLVILPRGKCFMSPSSLSARNDSVPSATAESAAVQCAALSDVSCVDSLRSWSVSYTHLDVYKRQVLSTLWNTVETV